MALNISESPLAKKLKLQTDLTRDKGWEILHGVDLKFITLISVNANWSALALRPYKEGEQKQSFQLGA